ncbi:hypothetical protein ACFQHZ_05160, partial [Marivibrio halodurans]|uniref:hypothetical protein n=1 Tax=Marivibrio halodurans TaxID=2039722 RepID=UPI0036232B8F
MADDPKFETREQLRRWLRDKPAAWGQAIACRAALRVLPLVGRAVGSRITRRTRFSNFPFQSFRANLISWAALKYPAHDMRAAAAYAAAYAADADADAAAYAAAYAAAAAADVA